MDMQRGEERVRCMESVTWKHITLCKIDSQWEFAVGMAQETQTGSASTQRGGIERKLGGRFKWEGIYVYLWLIHVEV